ncbi:MAG: caspase family protein [Acidobacteriaceae bacterium]
MRPRPSTAIGRTAALAVALAWAWLGARPAAAQGRCGAGVDLVVQALEKMRADSTADELGDADQLLKRAAELCGELGDAWYYRSLVERKLGHAALADFAMRQAQRFPSDASTEQLNPFVLSTPVLRAGTRAVTGPATASAPTDSSHPADRWALIVGIGSFTDQNIEPLKYTASDAQSFASALLDPKVGGFKSDHVRTLMNADATTRNIKMQLNWLARSAAPDDLVVVYVATHGSSRDLDTVGVNYIITHDTEIGANIDPDSLYATALPMVEISNAIATRVKARKAAIFLDTCYSGNAAVNDPKMIAPGIKNAAPSAQTLGHITQGSGRMVFAASGTEQESLESDTLKHGFFTYYLVQALHDEGGSAPLSQIFNYTQKHVSDRVATEFRQYNLQQTPVMGRSEDSTDFALGPGAAGPTR